MTKKHHKVAAELTATERKKLIEKTTRRAERHRKKREARTEELERLHGLVPGWMPPEIPGLSPLTPGWGRREMTPPAITAPKPPERRKGTGQLQHITDCLGLPVYMGKRGGRFIEKSPTKRVYF